MMAFVVFLMIELVSAASIAVNTLNTKLIISLTWLAFNLIVIAVKFSNDQRDYKNSKDLAKQNTYRNTNT